MIEHGVYITGVAQGKLQSCHLRNERVVDDGGRLLGMRFKDEGLEHPIDDILPSHISLMLCFKPHRDSRNP